MLKINYVTPGILEVNYAGMKTKVILLHRHGIIVPHFSNNNLKVYSADIFIDKNLNGILKYKVISHEIIHYLIWKLPFIRFRENLQELFDKYFYIRH